MKWIIYTEGVIRTPQTDVVIEKLEPYFEKAGFIGRVTSVLRDRNSQLAVIQQLAEAHKLILDGFELDFTLGTTFQGKEVPYWQLVWSKLLENGIIVNPPEPAVCLTDYISHDVNKKGQIIQPSPHFSGNCFDMGGRVILDGNNDLIEKIEEVYQILLKATADNVGIAKTDSSPFIEHGNNCVHSLIKV